eukprot:12400076-Karenia_brevis.AAC.1
MQKLMHPKAAKAKAKAKPKPKSGKAAERAKAKAAEKEKQQFKLNEHEGFSLTIARLDNSDEERFKTCADDM